MLLEFFTSRGAGTLIRGLAVVLVGEDPASQVYVRNKGKADGRRRHALVRARAAGVDREADLLELVERLNRDPASTASWSSCRCRRTRRGRR
jgi:5,10-methylene-tetrahydrofolate dehydrogenase/methenyl tetrahydrofolate cyclohydrolase